MLINIAGAQLPTSRLSPSLAIQSIAGGRAACRQQRFDTLCMAANRDMSAQAAAVSPLFMLADRDVGLSRLQQLLSQHVSLFALVCPASQADGFGHVALGGVVPAGILAAMTHLSVAQRTLLIARMTPARPAMSRC